MMRESANLMMTITPLLLVLAACSSGPEEQAYPGENDALRAEWFQTGRSSDDARELRRTLEALAEHWKISKRTAGWHGQRSDEPPTPWRSVGPRNLGGRIKALAAHPTKPDIVYAGAASGGVWKSMDGGHTWEALWGGQESLSVGALALAPDAPAGRPHVVYAGTGEWNYPTATPMGMGVYRSDNGGKDWKRLVVDSTRIARIATTGSGEHVYVAGNAGLEVSLDGGETWSNWFNEPITDVAVAQESPFVLYASRKKDGIYKTTDPVDTPSASRTWERLVNGPQSAPHLRFVLGRNGAHGREFLVARTHKRIHWSTDAGATWQTRPTGSGGAGRDRTRWCSLITVSPTNESLVLEGEDQLYIARSPTEWEAPLTHNDMQDAAWSPWDNPTRLYLASDFGVVRCDANADPASLRDVSDGLVVSQFHGLAIHPGDGSIMMAGSQDRGMAVTPGSAVWAEVTGGDGALALADSISPDRWFFVMRYIGAGVTRYEKAEQTPIGPALEGGQRVRVLANDSDGYLYAGREGAVMRLAPNRTGADDVSESDWVELASLDDEAVDELMVTRQDVLWIGTREGSLYRIPQPQTSLGYEPERLGGASFPTGRPVTAIVLIPDNSGRVVVCFGAGREEEDDEESQAPRGTVFMTEDDGASWTSLSGNLPPGLNIRTATCDEAGNLYAGTEIGVWRCPFENASWRWTTFDNGMPNVIVSELRYDRRADALVAATYGRGVYRVPLESRVNFSDPVAAQHVFVRDNVRDFGKGESPVFENGGPWATDLMTGKKLTWNASPDIRIAARSTPQLNWRPGLFHFSDWPDRVRPGAPCRVYVHVRASAIDALADVVVHLFCGPGDLGSGITLGDAPTAGQWKHFKKHEVGVLAKGRDQFIAVDWTVPGDVSGTMPVMAVVTSRNDAFEGTEVDLEKLVRRSPHVALHEFRVSATADMKVKLQYDAPVAKPFPVGDR